MNFIFERVDEIRHATEEGLGRALQLIKGGLEIIGENEILYGDMGEVYIAYNDVGISKEESLLSKAEECIKKVFALNPESSYGHYLRGMIHRRRGNAQEAVKEFKQSLAIDPSNPDAMGFLAHVYGHSGKGSAAKPIVSKLAEIDPLSPFTYCWEGEVDWMEGRFEIAAEAFGKAHQMDRESPIFPYVQAKALAYAGHDEEAIKLLDLLEKDSPQTEFARLGSFFKSALQSKKSEALQSATEELKGLAKGDEMFPIWMAESYALINEKNEAIDWLEQGINWGFINYPFLVEYDRFLANLRGEERFKKLMERVKKEWENFEV